MRDPRRTIVVTAIAPTDAPDRTGERWERVTFDAAGLLALLADITPAWHTEAACREHPEAEFFPQRKGSSAAVTAAKAICADCPVASNCLEHAVNHPETVGIWGGTSPRQRVNIRRQRREAPTTYQPHLPHTTSHTNQP